MGAFSELDMERSLDSVPSGFAEDDDSSVAQDDPQQEIAADVTAAAGETQIPADGAGKAQTTAGAAGASDGKDARAEEDEAAKRKAHEEAEAKRKAEFDAKQEAKKAAEKEQLTKLSAMSDDEVMAASMKRVSADTEKLTRRNMKECVAEYIQTRCLEDPAFARLTMHPRKSMIHCFWYINRKAREFVEQEMKDNDIKPDGVNGVYGSDVPDDLCYQWAEDYFRDPDAKEDHKDEEKFVPKPYNGKSTKSKATSKTKDKGKMEAGKKPAEETKPKDDGGQLSLLEMAS